MKRFAMGFAVLTLAGCLTVNATDVTVDVVTLSDGEAREIVEARNDAFEALFAADDAAGLAQQLYTSDGRLVPPDAPDMVEADAIAAYWGGAMGVIETVDLNTVEAVAVGNDYIAERTHVTLFGADGSVLGGGKAVILWALEDGTWKMQWDSWNNGPTE